jgi:hypothetical protein
MVNNSEPNFEHALNFVEKDLMLLGFRLLSFEKKGFAYFVQYSRQSTVVKFYYGPPEYEIVIAIYAEYKRFEFKDLLSNEIIMNWAKENKGLFGIKGDLNKNMTYFIELLKFSLPVIGVIC